MGESMDGFGLSWEQLLIAGVACSVLIVVLFAAFRGAGRARRRDESDASSSRPEAQSLREPPSFSAGTSPSAARPEPSLGASAAPARWVRSEITEPSRPSEPLPDLEPLPAFLSSPEPGEEPDRKAVQPEPEPAPADMSQFTRAGVDNTQAVKALKSEVDELRQANTLLSRRLEETERTLHDMQTEMQAKFASLDRGTARGAPISAPTPSATPTVNPAATTAANPAANPGESGAIGPRPPPPPRLLADEDNLARARRAIELLSRKDDEGA